MNYVVINYVVNRKKKKPVISNILLSQVEELIC